MAASLPRLLPACILLGALSVLPVPASAGEAYSAIERMNRALRDLSYAGEFVFQQDGRLEAMRIVHHALEGREFERLVVLNGNRREVIRDHDTVTRLAPGSDQYRVVRRVSERPFSPLLPLNPAHLNENYRFRIAGMSRTAGRDTQVIVIEPRDELRYGYMLYLDSVTYLPLRSRVLDEDGETLSELLFTALRVGDEMTDHDRVPAISEAAVARRDESAPQHPRLTPPAWRFTDLPSGFMLDAHRRRAVEFSQRPMEHFIFSDGLATVSVYIESLTQGAFEGVSTVGTLNALGRKVGNHQVTVVGEVPLKTLQQLASAVEPAGP